MQYLTPKRIALVLLLVPTVAVMLANLSPVDLQLIFWTPRIPLIYIILGSELVGFAGGWLTALIGRRKSIAED